MAFMVSLMAFTLVARAFASASRPLSATVRCDSEANTTHPPRVVVVGGGIMGSSAAFACKEAGYAFLLIESNI
jgi:NADPH-dependent 2,4-dienoyl-CoA reductase/sulfur reductase-like enzyme